MNYNLNLESLSISGYTNIIKSQNLLPSRRILLTNIDENFLWFEKKGIQNVAQLKKCLSSPDKIVKLSIESGISEEYLTILRREIGSLEQKPVLIDSFPEIDSSMQELLKKSGILNSKEYWERNKSDAGELFGLCDLVRINGVGPFAAKAFYEAGYKSVNAVAVADSVIMLEKVTNINEVKKYFKAKLGIKDMQFCIDFAKILNGFCD